MVLDWTVWHRVFGGGIDSVHSLMSGYSTRTHLAIKTPRYLSAIGRMSWKRRKNMKSIYVKLSMALSPHWCSQLLEAWVPLLPLFTRGWRPSWQRSKADHTTERYKMQAELLSAEICHHVPLGLTIHLLPNTYFTICWIHWPDPPWRPGALILNDFL